MSLKSLEMTFCLFIKVLFTLFRLSTQVDVIERIQSVVLENGDAFSSTWTILLIYSDVYQVRGCSTMEKYFMCVIMWPPELCIFV